MSKRRDSKPRKKLPQGDKEWPKKRTELELNRETIRVLAELPALKTFLEAIRSVPDESEACYSCKCPVFLIIKSYRCPTRGSP